MSNSTNSLNTIAAVSAKDIWAVGSYVNPDDPNLTGDRTLAIHYDGTQWTIVPIPSIGTSQNELDGVAAVSQNDDWAVGEYWENSGNQLLNNTLIEHWDGTSWTVVTSPNPGDQNHLRGIAVVSANDIWTVGNATTASAQETLALHWDGTS